MATKTDRDSEDARLLTAVHVQVGYLEKSLDTIQKSQSEQTMTLLTALQTHANEDTARFKEHDLQLKVLNNWRWYVIGGCFVLGVILAFLFR